MVIFNIWVYRFFNLIETFECLGGYSNYWDKGQARGTLFQRQQQGQKIYTGAFMVNSAGSRPGPGGKLDLVLDRIDWVWKRMPEYGEEIRACKTMEEAHKMIDKAPGVAGFLAYEMLIDMCYDPRVLPFSEDEWVNVGPGAKLGLSFLFPDIEMSKADCVSALNWLRWNQREQIHSLDLCLSGPELTLRNVEHSLCEFSKYFRGLNGGRGKRRYPPPGRQPNEDYSLWKRLPERFSYGRCWVGCGD